MAVTDDRTRELIGAPSRDKFKRWHKEGPKTFYGCDIDFLLVSKYPPGIVAILDYKPQMRGGALTFSEVLAYNDFKAHGYQVFIVVAPEPDDWCAFQFARFDIYEYLNGDWRPDPPRIDLQKVGDNVDANEYWEWERRLREQYTAPDLCAR